MQLALMCGLCLVGGHVQGVRESNQLYPYYSPSETTLDQFGVNTQRQSFNRRQLVVALASLFGNPSVLFAGLGVSTLSLHIPKHCMSNIKILQFLGPSFDLSSLFRKASRRECSKK